MADLRVIRDPGQVQQVAGGPKASIQASQAPGAAISQIGQQIGQTGQVFAELGKRMQDAEDLSSGIEFESKRKEFERRIIQRKIIHYHL